MSEHENLEELRLLASACLDGEADRLEQARFEAAQRTRPGLEQVQQVWARLDRAAQGLTAPVLDAEAQDGLWAVIQLRMALGAGAPTTGQHALVEDETRALAVPVLLDDAAEGSRLALHERLATPGGLEVVPAAHAERLRRGSSRLRAPRLDETASAALWEAMRARLADPAQVAPETTEMLRRAGQALPEPVLAQDAAHGLWAMIQERATQADARPTASGLALDAASVREAVQEPLIQPAAWEQTWAAIQARGQPRAETPVPLSLPRAKATPIRWAWVGGLAAAACLAIGLLLYATQDGSRTDPQVNVADLRPQDPVEGPADDIGASGPDGSELAEAAETPPPELLDNRYFMVVQHVPGLPEPVVCFFAKDDTQSAQGNLLAKAEALTSSGGWWNTLLF